MLAFQLNTLDNNNSFYKQDLEMSTYPLVDDHKSRTFIVSLEGSRRSVNKNNETVISEKAKPLSNDINPCD